MASGDGGRGLDELYRVSQVVLSVSRQLCVRDVLQVIVRSARSLAGARYAALGVPGPLGSFAEFIVDGISNGERRAIGPLPRQHGMLAVLLREARPLRLTDIRADPRFEGWPPAHPELSGFLGVPVRDGDTVLAIIFVANKAGPGPAEFTARDQELLALFAAHAAIALTNARLSERNRELSVLEERSRLARDLHDAVSQKLFSLRARARAAAVLAGRDAGRADDGAGFAPGAPGGLGFASMRGRAAAAGGTLTIRSAPGAGTTIKLAVPVQRQAGRPQRSGAAPAAGAGRG
jgi:signal transduction histidine kinase